MTEVAGAASGPTGDPRYVAALAVAEPVPQCAAVLDLLAGFAAADVADGDALRLLGMAAHAIGDTVRSVDFLDPRRVRAPRARAGSGCCPRC